jgi:hypothetical protein
MKTTGLNRLWILLPRKAHRIAYSLLIVALACPPVDGQTRTPISQYPIPPTVAQSSMELAQVTSPAQAARIAPTQGTPGQNTRITPIQGLGTIQKGLTTTQPVLWGFVDLHTHPMANLAFGGKLLYGGPDIGSLLPADPTCKHNVRANDEVQALGHDKSTHGGVNFINPLDNPCGDAIREQVIHAFQQSLNANDPSGDAYGYPSFADWPRWNDLTHQRMWVDWIRRAWLGGLRVMVALAVNNKSFGDLTAGPGDYATDDKASADLQLDEIKAFVGRHPDFMELALTSSDLNRIVSAGHLAVIMGVEIDHMGDLGAAAPTPGYSYPEDPGVPLNQLVSEIDRLYFDKGVRYIFPVHLLDNAIGGSAAYQSVFNASNVRESGHPWQLVCADGTYDHMSDFTYDNNDLSPLNIAAQLGKTGFAVTSISYKPCPQSQSLPRIGQKNSLALTGNGPAAIKEMMRLGMLIDIDHMSQAAADQALQLACSQNINPQFVPPFAAASCAFGYPMNSGHNAIRGDVPIPNSNWNERALRLDQYMMIGGLHGMAGVGGAKQDPFTWWRLYSHITQVMGSDSSQPYNPDGSCPPLLAAVPCGSVVAAFGTDTDGLEFGMPPPTGHNVRYAVALDYNSFAASSDGSKIWNFNAEGVAHYGMLPDFLQYLRLNSGQPMGQTWVDNNFMYGADYLYRTWQIAEARSKCVPLPPAGCTTALAAPFTAFTPPQQPPPPPLPTLSATVSSNGPSNSPVTDIVTVTSGGAPVAGATVTVGNSTLVTNVSGVTVVTHAACYSGSPVAKVGATTVPVRIPIPCGWIATASKTGYQPVSFSLP